MPKAKNSFYGVRVGKEGPKVYTSWDAASRNVTGFPGAKHKSFPSLDQAEAYISTPEPQILPRSKQSSGRPLMIDGSTPAPESSPSESSAPTPTSQRPPSLVESPDFGADFIPFEPSSPEPPDIVLSDEQLAILEEVLNGRSIFFTGSAGTGKSVLLREIIKRLRSNSGEGVAVTASTGIAGVNIGGGTLHSFAGIGLGKEPAEVLAKKIEKSRDVAKRWRATTTLIIDEISMVDGKLFDKLEYIARFVKNSEKPFGGIQLILSGDFYQLPPVPDRHDGAEIPAEYAFDARTWNNCVKKHVMLTKVFRQTDNKFINVLNEMRMGNMSAQSIQMFKALSRPVLYLDDLEPVELYPTRNQVDAANRIRLNQLPLPEQEFFAQDFPGYDIRGQPIPPAKAKELLDRLIAQDKLSLRVGAQVMLIQNMVQGRLVNGSMGTVVAFDTAENAVRQMVEIAKVDERTARNAARPMHAQGKDASAPEELVPKNRTWPIVEFQNGMRLLCAPVGFSVVNFFGGVEAQRDQVPLILSWALSIHKSQGQTLQRVKVDLGKVFEKGQAYVAISRATSLETLQILNFQPSRVWADPRVIEFHNRLGINDPGDDDSQKSPMD